MWQGFRAPKIFKQLSYKYPMNEPVAGALKWVFIVLIAGFIGYFGKYLAMIIIRRIRKETPETNIIIKTESDEAEKLTYKLEKKRLKLEEKKLKKKR